MSATCEAYGTVNHLKRIGRRNWGFYDKPFKFNVTVQSMHEINSYQGEQHNDHKLCNTQNRYAF